MVEIEHVELLLHLLLSGVDRERVVLLGRGWVGLRNDEEVINGYRLAWLGGREEVVHWSNLSLWSTSIKLEVVLWYSLALSLALIISE